MRDDVAIDSSLSIVKKIKEYCTFFTKNIVRSC